MTHSVQKQCSDPQHEKDVWWRNQQLNSSATHYVIVFCRLIVAPLVSWKHIIGLFSCFSLTEKDSASAGFRLIHCESTADKKKPRSLLPNLQEDSNSETLCLSSIVWWLSPQETKNKNLLLVIVVWVKKTRHTWFPVDVKVGWQQY